MTTNCLMRPRESCRAGSSARMWSAGTVCSSSKRRKTARRISVDHQKRWSSAVIRRIMRREEILVGFGHHAVLDKAEAIVNAVRTGKVRHFFLIGGCDGARPGRNYYTEFAKLVPKDCLILTLACGKCTASTSWILGRLPDCRAFG